MALRSVLSCKVPMIIILGATGTGKTKLGIELAQKFGSEIISADSMQIYKGLDIVTAKATRQERELVPHHLLDILEPHQMFTVVDFRNRALKINVDVIALTDRLHDLEIIVRAKTRAKSNVTHETKKLQASVFDQQIDNFTEQGKIPIIVGGTIYYIESIVYNILVEDTLDAEGLLWEKSKRKRDYDSDENPSKRSNPDEESENTDTTKILDISPSVDKSKCDLNQDFEVNKEQIKDDYDNESKFTNEEIHARLKAIDPVMASRLHPNNRRKVIRAIEVWLKSGRRHSEILDEQKLSEGRLRRPESTIILWLKCEQTVHDARLNARVDSMLEEGLIDELLNFHDRHNKQRIKDGKPADYTKGIFQTLGFKEFHEYLMLPPDKKNSEEGKKLLEESISNMKMGTRRYARRQNKMVKSRFLEHPTREIPPIYELDTTDLTKWDDEVKNKAIHIIESFVNKTQCLYESLKSNISDEKTNLNSHSSNYCSVCERLIIGDKEFLIHMNSHKHKRALKSKERRAQLANKEACELK